MKQDRKMDGVQDFMRRAGHGDIDPSRRQWQRYAIRRRVFVVISQ